MKTIEEQISGRCIHFTGIMDKVCKAGVEYDSFGRMKLGVIPCLRGGSGVCDKLQFPSVESVNEQMSEIHKMTNITLALMIAAKDHFQGSKQNPGKFICPHGDHLADYTVAPSNGHFWIRCTTCKVSMNE